MRSSLLTLSYILCTVSPPLSVPNRRPSGLLSESCISFRLSPRVSGSTVSTKTRASRQKRESTQKTTQRPQYSTTTGNSQVSTKLVSQLRKETAAEALLLTFGGKTSATTDQGPGPNPGHKHCIRVGQSYSKPAVEHFMSGNNSVPKWKIHVAIGFMQSPAPVGTLLVLKPEMYISATTKAIQYLHKQYRYKTQLLQCIGQSVCCLLRCKL